MWNSDTNVALLNANVIIGGINFTAPFNVSFPRGTILNMQAFKSGYTMENKTVTVQDTLTNGSKSQNIIFLLSANLVRNFDHSIIYSLSNFFLH